MINSYEPLEALTNAIIMTLCLAVPVVLGIGLGWLHQTVKEWKKD